MRIALDAMGGDFAPQPNIDGAIEALRSRSDLEIVLVGDRPLLEGLVAQSGYGGERLHFHASDGFVQMHEKPTEALRRMPHCSIAECWRLMANKEVEALVSAGHTGAVVAAGLTTRLFLPGVRRPGIAAPVPTPRGRAVIMDVGANPAARPEHLLQYGVMGLMYARSILGIEKPRVAVLNIGSEDGKGNELVRETQVLLANSSIREFYCGNIEGRELYQGGADVVICEGFVGNVALKVTEGMAIFATKASFEVIGSLLKTEKHVLPEAQKLLAKQFQYHEFGGAPLLGVDGVCIICHGSSNHRSIFNALGVAKDVYDRKINQQITEELAKASVSV